MWLSYISQLLKSAVDIVVALEVHSRPVMVHCTDGWDRTPQLTSLAKLLLDPYYRTIEVSPILCFHVLRWSTCTSEVTNLILIRMTNRAHLLVGEWQKASFSFVGLLSAFLLSSKANTYFFRPYRASVS